MDAIHLNSPVAAYHLARQFEAQGKVPPALRPSTMYSAPFSPPAPLARMTQEAIKFFSKAHRYNHAIRLAKEFDMDDELMTLAIQSAPALMVDAAKFFEQKAMYDRAVLLYRKGGALGRAIELCFRANLRDSLQQIADDLTPDADPSLLAQCAEFFASTQRFDKAVKLLVSAKEYAKVGQSPPA
ncbi:putative intraflagellar transport particle protein [Paratrimastix pyriformis]|uniref:Intraflagellar transport particle protein n=1 Tax=Paratrimastix pyriformis TaxID=342808 RepID=A0ABQ8U097_9EUKA|nr:putative intraflagellar transport particle protein [Paratrimastix pyriformis]